MADPYFHGGCIHGNVPNTCDACEITRLARALEAADRRAEKAEQETARRFTAVQMNDMEEQRDRAEKERDQVLEEKRRLTTTAMAWQAQQTVEQRARAEKAEAMVDEHETMHKKLMADLAAAETEIERLLKGHGERRVCEHRADAGGDGACPDCFGYVVNDTQQLRTHLQAVCDWAGTIVKSFAVDGARAYLAEAL